MFSTAVGDEERNCTPRMMDQFPLPFFSDEQRHDGMICINILICLYTFLALAILCHEYFVPSLERIIDVLGMEANVAGATIMAGGASCPQLATSVISVFLIDSDMGVGTIVGSAFFNVLFVLGVCGIVAPVICLHWWPMIRDTFAYIVAAILLTIVLLDEKVYWYEGLMLFLFYLCYIGALMFNRELLDVATRFINGFKRRLCCPEGACVRCQPDDVLSEKSTLMSNVVQEGVADAGAVTEGKEKEMGATENTESTTEGEGAVSTPRDDDYESIMSFPSSCGKRILWILLLPAITPVFVLVPDSRRPGCWQRLYLMTFIISIIVIGFASYILVWMLTIIGETLDVPSSLMGMTVLAAGDSIPDMLNAVFVAQKGYGDMAMSNCIGSNIFDILVCLGLPWLMVTITKDVGTGVTIHDDMTNTSLSLLASAVVILTLTYLNHWKLDRKLGALFVVLYVTVTAVNSYYDVKHAVPPC